jgi:two-component system cell cycle response regulator DivK
MKSRIPLIEDNEQNRYLMTYLLGTNGYEVVPAVSGPHGIEMAARVRPHLVVLDKETDP